MRKLLSLKYLSELLPKSISPTNSHKFSKPFHTLSRTTNNPIPIPKSNTPFLTHHHQWRSPTIHGFFSNPVLAKRFVSSAHFKAPIKTLLGSKVWFLRTQFPKGNPSQWLSTQRNDWRSWSRGYSADNVVLGLIVANAAVFMLWRILDRDFMYKNFTISVDNCKSGRIHTMITSAFSHIDMGHIASNMIGLYFFGSNIGRIFGPEYLLKLYLAGAVVGSIFYLVHHAFLVPKRQGTFYTDPSRIPGLGASGAVNAIMLLDIFLFPKATLMFDFFIPVPAILLGIFLIGKDVKRMLEGDQQISGSAHLGGAAVAAAAWLQMKRGRGLRF